MKQLHKKFSTEQVIELLEKYEGGNVSRDALMEVLSVSRTHFFRNLRLLDTQIIQNDSLKGVNF